MGAALAEGIVAQVFPYARGRNRIIFSRNLRDPKAVQPKAFITMRDPLSKGEFPRILSLVNDDNSVWIYGLSRRGTDHCGRAWARRCRAWASLEGGQLFAAKKKRDRRYSF